MGSPEFLLRDDTVIVDLFLISCMQNFNRELESLNALLLCQQLTITNTYLLSKQQHILAALPKHIVKRQSTNTASEHFQESEMTKS